MAGNESRRVLRYLPAQRFVHWMGAAGFMLLLVTGSLLVWIDPLPIGTCCQVRQLHRVGAVLYALWPVLYAILNPAGLRELLHESTHYTRDDIVWFKHAIGYFFGRTRGAPPQGRVNAGQKIHHLGVIVLSLVMAATGGLLLLGVGRLGAQNLSLIALAHDLCMVGLSILLVGHLYFTFLYGGLDAMLKGHVSEEYAQMEHAKWLASLPESAFIMKTPVLATVVAEAPGLAAAAIESDTEGDIEPLAEEMPVIQDAPPHVEKDRT